MKLGPYKIDNIYCGECADMMSHLPDNCIDLTVTSPPYDLVDENMVTHPGKGLRDYQGYDWDFVSVADQLWRVTKKGGVVVWVVGDATVDGSETGSSFRQALYFKNVGFRLHDTMIYEKANIPPSVAVMQNRYEQTFEYMFVFSKDVPMCNHLKVKKSYKDNRIKKTGHRIGNGNFTESKLSKSLLRIKRNIWRYKAGKGHSDVVSFSHPATFPEALARDHIISWSNPNDLIFDPFVGSGTVPKMAIEQGRHYLAFDISQKYVDLAKQRIAGARIPLTGMVL